MVDSRVSATDAGRQFPRLLRDVESGNQVTITKYGRPVAMHMSIEPNEDHPSPSVLERLRTLLRTGLPIGFAGSADRDAIYQRRPPPSI